MKAFKFGVRQNPAVSTGPSAELEEAQIQSNTGTTMCQHRWLRPDLASIPDELKALPQWVLWGKNGIPAGKEKTPFQPSGLPASSKDPATWSRYDQVILPYYRGDYAGIGFVLAEDDPYIGVDLDKCRNPEAGVLQQGVLDYLTTLASYTEVSPSGTGTHTIIRGSLPSGHRCRRKGIEIYSSDRYLTVTGHRLPEYPASIEDRSEQIAEVHKRVFRDTAALPGAPGAPAEWTTEPCRDWLGPESDDELLAAALKSRSVKSIIGAGATFRQLYEADDDALAKHYPDVAGGQDRLFDWSQADAALCAHLAYWTGRDCARMRELWAASELGQRDKFLSRPDYVESTILSACSLVKGVYRNKDYFNEDRLAIPSEAGAELNSKHALIKLGGRAYILNEDTDPKGRPVVTYSSVNDFKTCYMNQHVICDELDAFGIKKPNVSMTLAEAFLKHPNRRTYSDIVFDPSKTRAPGDRYYNYWTGLAVEPAQGDWSLMQDHIHNVISSGDSEISTWIYAWFARIIQEPGGDKPGTALVMRGDMGTGKGVFMKYLGRIFGRHYQHVTKPGHITGRFNSQFENKVLSFVDESYWAGDDSSAGALRALITEDEIDIEHKGKEIFTVDNHISWVFATNNDWAVPAGLQERRFFVIEVADTRRRDHAYFSALCKQMETGGTEAMLYDLQRYDFRQVDLRTFKHTKALFDDKFNTMSAAHKYWFGCLDDGKFPVTNQDGQPEWGVISKEGLYDAYVRFVDKAKEGRPIHKNQFCGTIKKLSPSVRSLRPAAKPGVEGRPFFWDFWDLNTCRAEFEKSIGYKVEWSDI